ncbi:hypothetical protein M5K25_010292 [Dendrobium thyrsiflorum]|uniref:Uncharacterized protein n=1 Tax=Dendrobium thyrsiflorum TaxID=117978 RepID=A0ABD0V0F6_DENTH
MAFEKMMGSCNHLTTLKISQNLLHGLLKAPHYSSSLEGKPHHAVVLAALCVRLLIIASTQALVNYQQRDSVAPLVSLQRQNILSWRRNPYEIPWLQHDRLQKVLAGDNASQSWLPLLLLSSRNTPQPLGDHN